MILKWPDACLWCQKKISEIKRCVTVLAKANLQHLEKSYLSFFKVCGDMFSFLLSILGEKRTSDLICLILHIIIAQWLLHPRWLKKNWEKGESERKKDFIKFTFTISKILSRSLSPSMSSSSSFSWYLMNIKIEYKIKPTFPP